jgi:hypothetical protein
MPKGQVASHLGSFEEHYSSNLVAKKSFTETETVSGLSSVGSLNTTGRVNCATLKAGGDGEPSGLHSVSLGEGMASGEDSVAMHFANADGKNSLGVGGGTASGEGSIASGTGTANAPWSMALGIQSVVNSTHTNSVVVSGAWTGDVFSAESTLENELTFAFQNGTRIYGPLLASAANLTNATFELFSPTNEMIGSGPWEMLTDGTNYWYEAQESAGATSIIVTVTYGGSNYVSGNPSLQLNGPIWTYTNEIANADFSPYSDGIVNNSNLAIKAQVTGDVAFILANQANTNANGRAPVVHSHSTNAFSQYNVTGTNLLMDRSMGKRIKFTMTNNGNIGFAPDWPTNMEGTIKLTLDSSYTITWAPLVSTNYLSFVTTNGTAKILFDFNLTNWDGYQLK